MYVCIRKWGRKGVLIRGQALVCHHGLGGGCFFEGAYYWSLESIWLSFFELFLLTARRQATTKTPKTSPIISLPTDNSRPNFPLTERQQLQYLLEVTAREAKQDFETGSNSSDELPILYNRTNAKKDVSKENQIETRIRKRNARGETALHVAAIRGDLEDVVALIKAGALVNAKDNAGEILTAELVNWVQKLHAQLSNGKSFAKIDSIVIPQKSANFQLFLFYSLK